MENLTNQKVIDFIKESFDGKIKIEWDIIIFENWIDILEVQNTIDELFKGNTIWCSQI